MAHPGLAPPSSGTFWTVSPADSETIYTTDDIVILTEREAIRKMPARYVGDLRDGTGLHTMVRHVVGNSIDEYLSGHASELQVTIEGSVATIRDNGRRNPIDLALHDGRSMSEQVLLAGHGKSTLGGHLPHIHFHRYYYHDLMTVNLLSSRLEVEFTRDGHRHRTEFERGKIAVPLTDLGPTNERGTWIQFVPDAEIFADAIFDIPKIEARLRELGYLNPGLAITFQDRSLSAPGGLSALLADRTPSGCSPVSDVWHVGEVVVGEPDGQRYTDVVVELALRRLNTNQSFLTSYYNQHSTENHGSHVDGFWLGALDAWHSVQADADHNVERQIGLDAFRDIFSAGLQAIVHVSLSEPGIHELWQGRLHSKRALAAVRTVASAHLAPWLKRQTELLRALDASG